MNIFTKRRMRYRGGALIPALLALAAALALLRLASMPSPENDIMPWTAPTTEPQVTLYRHESGEVTALALEDYVLGVVMAEMPLLFGGEALKAQAVCARTYALRGMTAARDFPGGADLSDDVQDCQSYVSLIDYQARNPEVDEELLTLATRAVAATRGEVLLYKETLADTVYHASCGGQTAAAAEVWGGESVPYLRSVRCNSDACRDYRKTMVFNAPELGPLLDVPADVSLRVKVSEKDESGRALRVRVGDTEFSGAELRRRLELPSTMLTILQDGRCIEIQAQGYGHGAGLCQHGAGDMGKSGVGYREILSHYYPGAELAVINW